MKAARIPNEIFNENTQYYLWKSQWKQPAFLMKYSMKAARIPNEMFNENSQNS